ncbi:cobalamin biosynthesis protein CobD, partial [Candidatus Aerophobetes bacterium]|nr:cobalamin biosynthesis protein CobD [Candidatus Aerophobetes bacterium]
MIFQIVAGFFLDIFMGDPQWFPHPVRVMGRLIKILEKILYKPYFNLKVSGAVLAILVVGVSWTGTFFVLYFVGRTGGSWLEFILGTLFIFTSLCVNDLAKQAKAVYSALDEANLPLARKKVGRIVGRDTDNLSEAEIIRATVETVAENSVDGILSPLFYAFLGGAPLALAYKAVNTLDSVLGYKNDKYFYFGWFCARLDDFANFIPARLSALIIPVAAFLIRKKAKDSFRTILRDGRKSPSPNAGIPEAGFAGALGIKLGGTNFYQGKREDRPLIGDSLREL